MTGDDHANGGTAGRFNQFLAASPAGCSVAHWECIRGTSYIYSELAADQRPGGDASTPRASRSACTSTPAAPTTRRPSLEDFYAHAAARLVRDRFPSLPAPVTNRTHCIVWSDWARRREVELRARHPARHQLLLLAAGVGARTRRACSPARACRCASPTLDGSMIDVYQVGDADDRRVGPDYPFTIDTLLDRALGCTGYYGAFNANMHTD